jgi:mono/diheme cytochrome c family protein
MVPLVTLIVLLVRTHVPQLSPGGDDLAGAARSVFAVKCVECHGPEVPFPKAAFGYVTDLHRLVASDKYIVPGQPEKSEIWKEISAGDMPPDGAKAGPLTQAESDAILAWIVAGAPVPQEGPGGNSKVEVQGSSTDSVAPGPEIAERDQGDDPPSTGASQQASRGPACRRLVGLLGRLHVVLVHFPVAMVITAALAEMWSILRNARALLPAVRFCLWVGAISALAAGGLGWIHAFDGFPGPFANPLTIAGLHRWIGTAAALLAPLVALIVERDTRLEKRSVLARGAIFALAAAVGVAAHFGGLLTHGPGYFDP